MSRRLIIAGAGGFGRGVYGWVAGSPRFLEMHKVSEIVFIDDGNASVDTDVPIISTINDYLPSATDIVICAIGNPSAREKVVGRLKERGVEFATFIDDRAVIGPEVTIKEGVVVCPGVVVSTGVEIKEHVHLNFNCSIGHDTVIGPFSTLSPSVNLMGELRIGASVFFGGSSAVLPRLQIGSRTQIGAGAVVTKNVPEDVVVKGVPGKWEG